MSEDSVGGKPAPQESETLKPSYLNHLRQKAKVLAEENVRYDLSIAASEISPYKPSSIPQKPEGIMRDDFFSLESLYELSEAGILADVASVRPRDKVTKVTEIGKLTIERLSDTHFGMVFSEDLKTDDIIQRIVERTHKTPIARAFLQNTSNFLENKTPETSAEFNFDEDPLASAAILEKLNFFGYFTPLISYDPRVIKAEAIAKNNILAVLQKNASLDVNDNISEVSIRSKEGVIIKLIPTKPVSIYGDLLKTNWKLAVIPDIAPYMLETANQSPSSRCESFINRPTGEALVNAIEDCGLRFTSDFEKFILTGHADEFEDRYGGAYSQISRVLAKVIRSREIDKLSSLIISAEGDPPTLEKLKRLGASETNDIGFKALQAVINDTLNALENRDLDPRMTKARVSITAGACFDVATYYSQALGLGKLRTTVIHGTKFFEKTHGAHTYMNLESIDFGGVKLPKGSLFTLAEDGGLAFLRFTPFMFDNRDDMLSAFGSEVVKAEHNGEDLDRVTMAMERAIMPPTNGA
ncbi:MAG: hypothetical protein HYV90_03895 [Candidatus Woesebacteria bacterium]|nr:MAG: hypothetical protein HYV90_03895 [Candidatus Woesebacteria bacterium]